MSIRHSGIAKVNHSDKSDENSLLTRHYTMPSPSVIRTDQQDIDHDDSLVSFANSNFRADFSQIPLHHADRLSKQAIQPKLTIGAPGDKYEQEADRVASLVVNQINTPVAQQSPQDIFNEPPAIQKRPWLRFQAKHDTALASVMRYTKLKYKYL